MYTDNRNASVSNGEDGDYSQLGLEEKMARIQADEDEIAAGLMNVLLHRLNQLGRKAFTPSDYRTLRLTMQAMVYLGQVPANASEPMTAIERQTVAMPKARQLVTQEEQQALISAANAESAGI